MKGIGRFYRKGLALSPQKRYHKHVTCDKWSSFYVFQSLAPTPNAFDRCMISSLWLCWTHCAHKRQATSFLGQYSLGRTFAAAAFCATRTFNLAFFPAALKGQGCKAVGALLYACKSLQHLFNQGNGSKPHLTASGRFISTSPALSWLPPAFCTLAAQTCTRQEPFLQRGVPRCVNIKGIPRPGGT